MYALVFLKKYFNCVVEFVYQIITNEFFIQFTTVYIQAEQHKKVYYVHRTFYGLLSICCIVEHMITKKLATHVRASNIIVLHG